MKRFSILASACALFVFPVFARAAVQVTNNADLTTVANAAGPVTDGTGVWFNPLTGYAESRGSAFPATFYEDGKFWLMLNASFLTPEAMIYTQGFFSRGNGVLYASTSNLNPARFGDGASIGPGVGYNSPGAGFPDLGPTFGNWIAGGHGYLGLTLRDPTGTTAADIFYGYAEINVDASAGYAVTLLSFAYNDVRNAPLTTVSTVPEPTVAAAMLLGVGLLGRRRRDA